MSKSGAPSATVSASASASSHDPHSLPPNIKGLIQRYLAVSLPTITLSPEIIVALDAADEIIPPRIQVTMRWWKEDAACSLSVYPKLNSPLPESVLAHQNVLQQHPHHRQHQEQRQHGVVSNAHLAELRPLTGPNARSLAVIQAQAHSKAQTQAQTQAHTEAQVQPEALTQQRSAAAAFLKRPWTGARLLRAFRKGKTKSQARRSPASAVSADEPADDRVDVDLSMGGDAVDIAKRPASIPKSLTKPLPSLPEAAYPITVAYPVRCSLEQLRRYFIEMATLTLDVQITPELSVLATVPNLADLFHNIHGTFSGVFPFATVLQNDNPRLAADPLFQRRVVLGMVVFQAWSQDTSEVGDTSDESESMSTGSIVIPSPTKESVGPTPLQLTPHHRQHIQLHQPPAFNLPEQLSFNYTDPMKQSRPPWHPSYGLGQRQQVQKQDRHAVTPTRGFKQDLHGLQSTVHRLDQEPPNLQPTRRFDSNAFVHEQGPTESRSQGEAASTRERHSHSHRQHARQISIDARGGSSHSPGRRLRMRIPVPDIRVHHTAASQRPALHGRRPVVEEASDFGSRRRSEDTNFNSLNSQGSRSRPRAGATAAAIGRLDTVLARGEDLRHGMKTSLDLDPEEVRARTARNIRTSPQSNDQDVSTQLPYQENLPYWPAKSRFNLELSIPTAYLTSRGLLKGSAKQKKIARVPSGFVRQGVSSVTAQRQGWGRESSDYSQGSQQDSQQDSQQSHQSHQSVAQRVPSSLHYQESPQTPIRFLEGRQGARCQQQQPHQSGGNRSARPSGSNVSAPRMLRRSERPIRFERLSPRSELERLRKAQEESALPHYQSFLTSDSQAFSTAPSGPVSSRDKVPQNWHQHQQPQYRSRPHEDTSPQQEHLRQQTSQPRKSKSYPPNLSPSAPSRKHRRRLSSNDRLQIRMNPKAGDIINFVPNLFPARSMSTLIKPEYRSSQGSRSSRSNSLSNGFSSFGSSSSNSSMGMDEKEYRLYGSGGLEGRQSRLQKRTRPSSHQLRQDIQPSNKRHQHRLEHGPRTRESRKRRDSRARSKSKRHVRGSKSEGESSMHPQHFNFLTQCDLLLTPDVMAACMVENISVEVWKLNKKRQTMTELGSAKLPLHRVLSRILRTTMAASAFASASEAGVRTETVQPPARHGRHIPFPSEEHPRSSTRGPRDDYSRSSLRATSDGGSKEGWRLEPSVYDIRSRSGTLIGHLDAEVWIHPRSRSDSMVSAAA